MRRAVCRATAILGTVALVMALAPATAAFANGRVVVSFTAEGDWNTGHQAKITIANGTGKTLDTWRIVFRLPQGNQIKRAWKAEIIDEGGRYVAIKKRWVRPLKPGDAQSWGYIATGSFSPPSWCTINGLDCRWRDAPTPGRTTPKADPEPYEGRPEPRDRPVPPTERTRSPSDKKIIGYLTDWSVYGRDYHVKDVETSGAAGRLTHLVHAFGNVIDGTCVMGDAYTGYQRAYSARESVDGVADGPSDHDSLRGVFGQLRKLKARHSGLKVLWSFGGWEWSRGFGQAAANPRRFAESCLRLVKDPRWSDVFDGIDIDWEFPNACGVDRCDSSGRHGFANLIAALRGAFGPAAVLTSAITADGSDGGKLDNVNYGAAARYLDWLMPMTYEYFGMWNPRGPTAPNSPLTSYEGMPHEELHAESTIEKLRSQGVPMAKILLGVSFVGLGWTGVRQREPGAPASGPAPGGFRDGFEDYRVLRDRCPAIGMIGGTAYAKCGSEWWSYDTPMTLWRKMLFVKENGLGGAFCWEISADTSDGELIEVMRNALA